MAGRPKVVLFKQAGCPACADVVPYVERLGRHYAACIDTEVWDLAEHAEEGERWGVEAVPDICSFDADGRPLYRLTGYVDSLRQANRIYQATLTHAQQCRVEPFFSE